MPPLLDTYYLVLKVPSYFAEIRLSFPQEAE